MSSSMISCRIFGCVLLILLSQYTDARKSYYLETILDSLQRLENLIRQTERNAFCIMPTEKLCNLILEHQTSYESNDPNENNTQDLSTPKKKQQKKDTMRAMNNNENVNINENYNTNLDALKRHHRRSFGDDSRLRKMRNQNANSNVNLNSNVNANRNDAFDFSDEDV
ncbi:hypothetical protein ALC57_06448 [Trachymyrmex cornetzi]|uniref:Uncharacterized protein n=1 Tax=Trachymyrmex cornetzi TaxID=471704 RepID=A0A151J8L0_9HYME|nr:hypothetical protein ALC57_06448 [Trachymyrmex cornetzi]